MKDVSRTCLSCNQTFTVSVEDQNFLKQLSPTIAGKVEELPPPTHCVDCREQRRLAVANQLFLYKRTCDLTGETVVSNIHPDSPYKVYKQSEWYTDKWDPLSYGRAFDFSRPFFDQWHELSLAIPRPSLFTGYQYDENSDYTNHAGKNKDCYMIFDSDENRDCYYSYSINSCVSCMECFRLRKSELCYSCIDSLACYSSAFLQDCDNCSDSMYLKNCIGCRNCLMCSNLKNKEYHIENKTVSKAEFEKVRAMLTDRGSLSSAAERFKALALEYPQKYMHGIQNENVLGDYITGSKNAHWCFDSADMWDCRYIFQGFMPLKNCMDIQECGEAERLYECAFVGYGGNSDYFCTHILGDSSDMLYCCYCPHSKYCFGCIGLRHKQYCVFNVQYTKEEYEALVPKIIEYMRHDGGAAMNSSGATAVATASGGASGSWGEFYPINVAYAAYNETLAQDYFPLTREEALKRGYTWRDADPKSFVAATAIVPADIASVADDITHEMLACSVCRKNYRIIPQELALYRQMNLPLPDQCFECRLREKRQARNPRVLWKRECMKCNKVIETAYSPERPEIIYCEKCYLSSVY